MQRGIDTSDIGAGVCTYGYGHCGNKQTSNENITNNTMSKETMSTAVNKKEEAKESLWAIAHKMEPMFELEPGFSFDSDSKITLYD